MKDELPAPLRTVGATRSVFEREFELSQEDPFAGLGDPDEGGVISGDVLGAGGMGVVHAGIQTALQRQVAVKRTLHREAGAGDEAFLAFLREAWISAKLEHPNIIPVHALCSDRGDPQLVMKRVEGVAWRALLDDDALASEHGMRDRLAFHLAILGRVCRAVHFAHSRGIVHLDLKPDNVMVGRHGEVYLLDWGVAASFHEDADPWVPRTVDIRTVMGTPAYLSPEQAAALGGLIGPRTDVFLLGALIHRIVMGRPPHRGETMDVVMRRPICGTRRSTATRCRRSSPRSSRRPWRAPPTSASAAPRNCAWPSPASSSTATRAPSWTRRSRASSGCAPA